jgi:hypothetical protein
MQDEVVGDRGREPADEPAERGVRWVPIVAAVAVLAIAVGAGLYLFRTQTSGQASEPLPPARGLACPHLLQAADAYERGDLDSYHREIELAANAAEDALQTSGQIFGEPERIALELNLQQSMPESRVLALLGTARDRCGEGG